MRRATGSGEGTPSQSQKSRIEEQKSPLYLLFGWSHCTVCTSDMLLLLADPV